jgi:secreted trypsin-like serine protease
MTWFARVAVAVLAATVLTQPASAAQAPGVVGGEPATVTEHPWTVVLIDQAGQPFCAGTLTTPTTVVTAAHCLLGRTAATITVLGGRTDLSQITQGETVSGVSDFEVPPTFVAPQAGGDIATLTLQVPFPYRPLPPGGPARPGTVGTVVGWGDTDHDTETTVLHALTVPILPPDTCRAEYDEFVTGAYDPTAMFCAGYTGQGEGACTGDAGAPLEVDGTLVGIVSWSVGCGQHPDFYTNVASYAGA